MVNKIKSDLAFTLIELMVVITIIALMFGVVISSANFLRSTSNDARRKADLAEIQSALQNYYADLNYYPHSVSASNGFKINGTSPTTVLTNSIGASAVIPNPSPAAKVYLREVPFDPVNQYCYKAFNNSSRQGQECNNDATNRCHFYYLSVKLENPNSSQDVPDDAECGTQNNYVVTP